VECADRPRGSRGYIAEEEIGELKQKQNERRGTTKTLISKREKKSREIHKTDWEQCLELQPHQKVNHHLYHLRSMSTPGRNRKGFLKAALIFVLTVDTSGERGEISEKRPPSENLVQKAKKNDHQHRTPRITGWLCDRKRRRIRGEKFSASTRTLTIFIYGTCFTVVLCQGGNFDRSLVQLGGTQSAAKELPESSEIGR